MLVRRTAVRQPVSVRCLVSSRPLLGSTSSRCSAALLAESRRALTTSNGPRPGRRSASPRPSDSFERNIATAAGNQQLAGSDVPFQGLPAGLAASAYRSGDDAQPQPLYMLRPFSPTAPLVLQELKAAPPRQRINPHGIPGDFDEMVAVFEACLQVGRLDRASMVLSRLRRIALVEPEQAIKMHNQYLKGRIAQLSEEPDNKEIADGLHKWFEKEIRAADLPLRPITVAYMLKATLLAAAGRRRKVLLKRYMELLAQKSHSELVDLGNVLSDDDLATLSADFPSLDVMTSEDSSASAVEEADLDDQDGSIPGLDGATDGQAGTPEVLGTPQKGLGLKSLKTALSLLSELPPGLNIASLSNSQRREVQARLERDCVDAALARWRDENEALMKMGLNSQLSDPSLNSKLFQWHQALEARIAEEQAQVEVSENIAKKTEADMDRCIYGPQLLQAPASRLAAVTILSILSTIAMSGGEKGVPVAGLVQNLAKIAEEDIRTYIMTKNLRSTAAAKKSGLDIDPAETNEARWPISIRSKLGAVLLSALIETAKVVAVGEHPETKERITQLQAAFTHAVQLKRGRKTGVILPNRHLVDLMKREPRGEALARHLPMVVEPEPWTRFDKGGFVSSITPMIRLKNNEIDQRIYAEAAIERGDMEQMMRGLDVLGKTAWKINRSVFDVMLEAWNTGDEFANLPALNPQITIPPEPDSTDDPMKKRHWLKAVKAAESEKIGLHSVRCFMNFQLEIARAFRDQTFYFPHNIDFRGRAYPMPTYLNHMGADHMRGLLLFAKGKPLGEAGLKWLKVHVSNVYGYDKASLKQREDFAMEHMKDIFDSADNPLTGKRWWLDAEDPWQCLATCFELKAALSSPDPAAYVCHLPVHQDGTCNGLQHYAALGGDTWGATQVNLLPGDRPADVYAAVAELVQKGIEKDVAAGNKLAAVLDGKITRKVVKQPVMTNVYGVTFMGAKKQLQRQLEDLYPNLANDSGTAMGIFSSYLAGKVFMAMSTMFRGAHDIQNWLGEIGGRVCRAITQEQLDRIIETLGEDAPVGKQRRAYVRSDLVKHPDKIAEKELQTQFRNTVVWTTPLRMPVVQPYRKSGTRLVSTCLQDLILSNVDRDDPVNRRKQLQAFPPNFIHSLDASHMMLSALECSAAGLTFAAVHDSFWTHAGDIDRMNTVLRDCFIRIHKEDVIGRLKAEFEARYRGAIYRATIAATSPTGRLIHEHRKENRKTPREELIEERRRQVLLNSDDPADVEKGKAMVTPASIFDAHATPDMLLSEVQPSDMLSDADALDAAIDADMEAGLEADHEDMMAEAADESEDGAMAEAEAEADEQAEAEPGAEAEADVSRGKVRTADYFASMLLKPKQAKKSVKKLDLWMPITFPEIPAKGDFDVTKLKESKYFFS